MYICAGECVLMTVPEAQDYASQATFEHGGTMCTSAAVFWALSCVLGMVEPVCSKAQMQLLMKTAAATHSSITTLLDRTKHSSLQQNEVLAQIQRPCSVSAVELYGYCTQKLPELSAFVHLSDLFALLLAGESLVLTGGGHTTALFRDTAGVLYGYDSLPACVRPILSPVALTTLLLSAHKNMEEFTATRLGTPRVASAEHTGLLVLS